ncbi:VCBS repeat-containing protein [Candidatus Pacearchaeota archaeon]|nr:VCBS repeat-containing protein [Candidatus Pacearchaeota archaeon]
MKLISKLSKTVAIPLMFAISILPQRELLAQQNSCGLENFVSTNITNDTQRTRAIKLADMNRDGFLDVIVANEFGDANKLYLNNGTQFSFESVTGKDIPNQSYHANSLAIGDINRDGALDILTAGYLTGEHFLYLNNRTPDPFNGVGGVRFAPDTGSCHSIALGDLNRDGSLDVILGTYNPNSTNNIYFNNNTPNPFTGVAGVPLSGDINHTPSVAIVDIDNDGDNDIIAGNAAYNGELSYLYLNNGTANPFNGVIGLSLPGVGSGQGISVGDTNNDGYKDLILSTMGEILFYRNNRTNDPFRDIEARVVDYDSRLAGGMVLSLGDVNLDGYLDLISGFPEKKISLYLNNKTSNSFDGVSGIDLTSDIGWIYNIDIGDVNRDGALDIVAAIYNRPNLLFTNMLDRIPPIISLSVTPGFIWPPNNKMVQVYPSVESSDNCDPNPSVYLKQITSSEGNVKEDTQIDSLGNIFLRAQRYPQNNGRVYTITYESSDSVGNTSESSVEVIVPKNNIH